MNKLIMSYCHEYNTIPLTGIAQYNNNDFHCISDFGEFTEEILNWLCYVKQYPGKSTNFIFENNTSNNKEIFIIKKPTYNLYEINKQYIGIFRIDR